jgi:hypothetical protein
VFHKTLRYYAAAERLATAEEGMASVRIGIKVCLTVRLAVPLALQCIPYDTSYD